MPVPAYDGSAPTEEDALRSLRTVLGSDAEMTWDAACRYAGVKRSPWMSSDDVAKAAGCLVSQGGLVAVFARSIIIRANTYAVLALKVK